MTAGFREFAELITPEKISVPRGALLYSVTVQNSEGETGRFITYTEPNRPDQLRETVFDVYQETVDYSFHPTTRKKAEEEMYLAITYERVAFQRQLMSSFLLMQERGI